MTEHPRGKTDAAKKLAETQLPRNSKKNVKALTGKPLDTTLTPRRSRPANFRLIPKEIPYAQQKSSPTLGP
jgi:hypothetical protein